MFTVGYNSSKSPCLQYFPGKSANFSSYKYLSKKGTFRGTYSFRHAISDISPNPLVNDISVLDGGSRGRLRENMASILEVLHSQSATVFCRSFNAGTDTGLYPAQERRRNR